jgi:hypothetical protein
MDKNTKPYTGAPKAIHPFQVVLAAFQYFKDNKGLDEIDLDGLINVCVASGCPTSEVAQQILANMVDLNLISFRKDEGGTVYFSPVKVVNTNVN